MKKLFLFFLFFHAFFSYSQNVTLINEKFDFVYPEKVSEPSELEPNKKIFKDSLEDGRWIAYSKYDNDYCVIEVKRGKIDGTFFYKYPDGKVKWKIGYKEGKKEGVWQRFSEDKILMDEIPYENNLANGQIKKYSNGVLSGFLDYQNGIENGKFVGYHDNGKLSFDGTFVDGKREGQFFNYDSNGFLYLIEFYKGGELKKKKKFRKKTIKKRNKI